MHLRNYEKPDGWSNGQPEVLVAPKVIEHLGLPSVKYEGLHELLTDNLDIPYDSKTIIKLYGRSPSSGLFGFHVPYTRTIHVNPVASECRFSDTGGTMRVLAHEARHRSDSTNRKAVTAVEIAARWATYKLGYEAVAAMPYISFMAIYGGLKARGIYYRRFEPAEKRARAEEIKPTTLDHEQDILFPKSMRTIFLLLKERLDTRTITELGMENDDAKYFASDRNGPTDT